MTLPSWWLENASEKRNGARQRMTVHHKAPTSSGVRNIGILFGVVAVLYLARELLIPLAFAIILAMILAPIVALLEKLRLGRVPSALIVLVLAIASVGGISWVIFHELIEVAIQLPEYRENINKKIAAMNAPGKSALGQAAASVQALENRLRAQRQRWFRRPAIPCLGPMTGNRAASLPIPVLNRSRFMLWSSPRMNCSTSAT